MKKSIFVVIGALCVLVLSSCTRTGEKDSIDFISALMRLGYDCSIEETLSGEKLKESCYINGCKLSLYSNGQGKLVNLSVTYVAGDSEGFSDLARATVQAFCGFSAEETDAVFSALGIGGVLPSDSEGVKRCDTEWYGFSFTCDEVGGALAVVSYRLEPTSAPKVTLNTTVPFVTSASPEEASS